MNLEIQDVVKLYQLVRSPPCNYMQACREYGVARFVIDGWDIEITHARLMEWGPIKRWGYQWHDHLYYELIKVEHADFLIELDAHPGALMYHSTNVHTVWDSHTRHVGGNKSHKYCYNLDWCGDMSVLEEVFVYHCLIM